MRKCFIVALFLLVIGINNVYALDPACTKTEQDRLKKLASQVYFTYEPVKVLIENNTYNTFYEVSASGLLNDLYIYNTSKAVYLGPNNGKIVKIVLDPGESYDLPFYASDNGACRGYLITTKNITLPKYNIYSESALCKGYEEFTLCNPVSPSVPNSEEEFIKALNKYIASKNKVTEEETNEVYTPSIAEQIFIFLSEYYLYISGGLAIVGITGIALIQSKKREEVL